jgi:hypothetical protein
MTAPLALEAIGLVNPLGLLFRFDPIYLMGLENLAAPVPQRLCLPAWCPVASVRPHAMASIATTDLFVSSSLGSMLRPFSFFHSLTCNILA